MRKALMSHGVSCPIHKLPALLTESPSFGKYDARYAVSREALAQGPGTAVHAGLRGLVHTISCDYIRLGRRCGWW